MYIVNVKKMQRTVMNPLRRRVQAQHAPAPVPRPAPMIEEQNSMKQNLVSALVAGFAGARSRHLRKPQAK